MTFAQTPLHRALQALTKGRGSRLLGAGLCVALLSACTLSPDYHRPELNSTAAQFKHAEGWTQATPSDAIARGAWWEIYGDAGSMRWLKSLTAATRPWRNRKRNTARPRRWCAAAVQRCSQAWT